MDDLVVARAVDLRISTGPGITSDEPGERIGVSLDDRALMRLAEEPGVLLFDWERGVWGGGCGTDELLEDVLRRPGVAPVCAGPRVGVRGSS